MARFHRERVERLVRAADSAPPPGYESEFWNTRSLETQWLRTLALLCVTAEIFGKEKVEHELLGQAQDARAAVIGLREMMDRRDAAVALPDSSASCDGPIRFFGTQHYCLNNFSAYAITCSVPRGPVGVFEPVRFPTAEHLYQYLKFAIHQACPDIAEQILAASSPDEAYAIAQRHRALRFAHWRFIRMGVMTRIERAKAEQHAIVRERLIESRDRLLIEDNPDDPFWGSGPDGRGQNKLGQIWMHIRRELQVGGLRPTARNLQALLDALLKPSLTPKGSPP